MDKNNEKPNLKRKREKICNKRWTDSEIKQLLEYLQEHRDFEKPTAQIFYRKFLETTLIDASWDLVRWKVKNLKTTYNKAETWRKSTGAGLLESDEGVSSVQDKLRKLCRFYDELHSIFGQSSTEFPFEIFDSATTSNLGIHSTPISDNTVDEIEEFFGFESLDEYCSTPVIQYAGSEAVAIEDDCVEVPTSSTVPERLTTTPRSSLSQEPQADKGLQQKNKAVVEFAAKIRRAAPKNSLDQLSQIQSVRNSVSKMKVEFEKEKFQKEFEFNERKYAGEVEERKERFELRKLEIQKEERLRTLELEKQERIERFEIEMRYKYASHNRD